MKQCFPTFLRQQLIFRTSTNFHVLKKDYDYENNTNTSFRKFGLSHTSHISKRIMSLSWFHKFFRNKGLWLSIHTWRRLLLKLILVIGF